MERQHRRMITATAMFDFRKLEAVFAFLILVLAALPWGPCAEAGIDLSNAPTFTRILPPPANIMFLLDDSGSMNFEILVSGEFDGSFPNPAKSDSDLAADPHGFCYVFDDVGDNVYKYSSQPDWYAGPEGRKYWKSQWHIANVMYYNPHVTYIPWPSDGSTSFTDADKDTPRSHPVLHGSCTLDLDATSFTIGSINVPHAHYFAYSVAEDRPYLIIIERASASIQYYAVSVSGAGLAQKVSALTPAGSPPDDVLTGRSYNAERENFANWFTYYRRREFVAKNAVASIIKSMAEVRIGIYGINKQIVAPLEPVMVTQGTTITDTANSLLEKLYAYQSSGGTPLKHGLHTIGSYYKDNTGVLGTVTGPKPYEDGGQGAPCQQSFTVVLTDGYYTDLSFSPSMIGNSDGDDGTPYSDAYSNSLADIAMYYYENDLSGLPDQVPANTYDRATHQHMTTYAVAFGVNGTLNPIDYDASFRHNTTGQSLKWPGVTVDRTPETIDDLWHATLNGRGKFFNAANPQELVTSLNDVMNAISEVLVGSASTVTVNGDFLYGKIGGNTYLYQGTYNNRNDEWTGDVKAFGLNPATGEIITNPIKWSAAQKLESKECDRRLIATFDGAIGIPFDEAALTGGQLAALGPNPANKVKYLRGGAVSGYRLRSQKLGDIVNSAPVFENGVIYCGANDGMLHAFDAETGEELFAYVPNLVFANLKLLADPAYTHRFYVDLTPSIKKGAGILGGTEQKSLLVGGLRKGGRGYFALDITSAKTITTASDLARRVLWEFPQTIDLDMGYSYSKPVIVKSNSSTYPWLVIFGNGYNSDSGKSVLFIVNPASGQLIKKIEADAGPDNGLSSPIVVDVTHDGKADFVYAGDLKGKLWKFDLSQDGIDEWKVAFTQASIPQPLFQAEGSGGSLQPITCRPDVMNHPEKHGFIVCFGTGKYLGDTDFSDTSLQSVYGIWDYGDRVYSLKTKTWSQDDDDECLGSFLSRTSAPYLSNQLETVKLLKQVRRDYALKLNGKDIMVRVLSTDKPIWETIPDPDNASLQKPDPSNAKVNDVGYYFDLAAGERIISDVSIRDGKLIVIGFTPNDDPCGPGGKSMFMEINAFTGGNPGSALFDISRDRKVDTQDLVRIDFDVDGTPEDLPPAGLEFFGNLQPPAILGFDGGDDDVENKYMSSTTGTIEILSERPPKLGVTYWMEIRY